MPFCRSMIRNDVELLSSDRPKAGLIDLGLATAAGISAMIGFKSLVAMPVGAAIGYGLLRRWRRSERRNGDK